jgi:8-oxo-dGTP pyrophosphatase MutT (NUDIX family)
MRLDLERVREHDHDTVGDEQAAAVLVGVIDRGEQCLLFTRRAEHLGEHPGQMSFPGGAREPEDSDIVGTAVRETGEEIGAHPEEITVVGRLDDIHTVSRYAVTPVVGHLLDREYVPDEREVAEIAVLPIAPFLEGGNYEVETRTHPAYGETVVHHFHVGEYTVWGATARILVQLFEVTAGWRPPGRQ